MIVSQAQLTIADHYISIAQTDQGHVYCFKHTMNNSDWDYFEDLESATDYIFAKLPEFKYVLKQQNNG